MKRSEVPAEQTWDLGLIYRTREEAWKDAEKAGKLADEAEEKYKGRLTDAKTIVDCLHLYEEMSMLADKVYIYFSLGMETDYSDAEGVADANRAEGMMTDLQTKTSFIESEVLDADDDVIREYKVPVRIVKDVKALLD